MVVEKSPTFYRIITVIDFYLERRIFPSKSER